MVGALLAAHEPDVTPFVDKRGVPWWTIMKRASSRMTITVVGPLTDLLRSVRGRTDDMVPGVSAQAGAVARRVLEFARDHPSLDHAIVTMALRLVCRTYGSNVEASQELLRLCLEDNAFDRRGIEEMYAIASEIDQILAPDPAFARDIYRTVFSHHVTSRTSLWRRKSGLM
jgi:hypothetical protein